MYTIYLFNILVAILLMAIGGSIVWPLATMNERCRWYEAYYEQDEDREDVESK